MKVLLMANNWGGVRVLDFLKEYGEDVVGLVIHNPKKRKYTGELIMRSGLPNEKIITARELRLKKGIETIRKMKPDIIVCAFFQYLLKDPIIKIPKYGCINIHSSYLPINRGWHPNEWPILDDSVAGVTIYKIVDEGADNGPIIARKIVPVLPTDTGETLHRKLIDELIELFFRNWKAISENNYALVQQKYLEQPNYHSIKEVEKLTEILPLEEYTFIDLMDVLRARTYPPYPGCYYIDPDTGKKIYIWVKLMFEEDLPKGELPKW